MQYNNLNPKKRSILRVKCGKVYYRSKRYLNWIKYRQGYCSQKSLTPLNHTVFKHQTPLFRKLNGVEHHVHLNKIKNLKIALKQLNGLVIKPGETFSYWKCIGKPTKRKGYVEGMVLDHGNYKMGVGGGLCQFSNLIFWMAIHSPLDVIERHRHSYDVFPDSKRSQPFGSGATCVYNYRDLQLKNTTNETYQFNFYIDDTHLKGVLSSNEKPCFMYEVTEKNHHITHEYWGGYLRHNEIYRSIYNLNDDLVGDEKICENHALMMYAPLLE